MKQKFTITSSKTMSHSKIYSSDINTDKEDWKRILDMYEEENADVASIDLESLVSDVLDDLDMYVEPSGQNGVGTISIYDNTDGDTILDSYDLQKWSSNILDLAYNSETLDEFKSKYKSWLEDFIYG